MEALHARWADKLVQYFVHFLKLILLAHSRAVYYTSVDIDHNSYEGTNPIREENVGLHDLYKPLETLKRAGQGGEPAS